MANVMQVGLLGSKTLETRDILFAISYFVIILGAFYRFYYLSEFNPVSNLWSDPERHWHQGIKPLDNSPMALTDPILYQLYIGALAKLTYKDSTLLAFYTAILSLVGVWAWYRFLRELLSDKLVATMGWAVLSILPSWISIYAYFMQETLLIPMLGFALYFTWKCKRQQSTKSFSLMILFWILAGLTRGICIPLAAAACIYLWIAQEQKVRKAVYALLILSFILGPLVYRGYKFSNTFSPHGSGNLSMVYALSGKKELNIKYSRDDGKVFWNYVYTVPSMFAPPFLPLSDWNSQREGTAYININLDKGFEDWGRYLSLYFPENLESWMFTENLAMLFFGPSWPDSNTDMFIGNANYHARWIWFPLLVICLGVGAYRHHHAKKEMLLPLLITVFIVVQGLMMICINEGRYRKPFEGLIIAQMLFLAMPSRKKIQDDQDKPVSITVDNS